MHKFLLVVGVVSLMALGVGISANPAQAATECNGTVTGTISGGLVVHPGDNCNVQSATVSGAIIMDGGTLTVCDSTIDGSVIVRVTGADSASSWVNFANLEQGCGGNNVSGTVNISGVQGVIPGDELGSSVELEHNTIGGSLIVSDNGLTEVESNTVVGSAHCNGPTTNFFNFLGPNVYASNHGCPA